MICMVHIGNIFVKLMLCISYILYTNTHTLILYYYASIQPGGEKKRLSIGNELIGSHTTSEGDHLRKEVEKEGVQTLTTTTTNTKRTIVFCDEPTSGLDSYQAQRVMQLLKDITMKGYTVISSIHQPRSSIYSMFDEITLLSEGNVIYTGDAQAMPDYFAALGTACINN